MRKSLFLALSLILSAPALIGAAWAADLRLPTKAEPLRATCPVGTGFYAGINTYAQVANGTTTATITPTTTVSINSVSDGAAIGATVGWAFGDCASGRFYALEGLFDYQNLAGTNGVTVTAGGVTMPVTAALNSKWEFTQRFKIGANLSDVLAFLPSFGAIFPGMPQIAPGTSNPKAYIAAVVREDDVSATFTMLGVTTTNSATWAVEPGIGTGIQSVTANGSVIDVFSDYTFKGAGFTVGGVTGRPGSAVTANLGGTWRMGVQVLW